MRPRSFRHPGAHDPWQEALQIRISRGTIYQAAKNQIGRGIVKYLGLFALAAFSSAASAQPAAQWIDRDTGHRVLRISNQPGTQSLYFHQNAYTPQGDILIVNSPSGIQAINLKTWSMRMVVPGKVTALFVA